VGSRNIFGAGNLFSVMCLRRGTYSTVKNNLVKVLCQEIQGGSAWMNGASQPLHEGTRLGTVSCTSKGISKMQKNRRRFLILGV
jgi:hypothetical protein